MLSLLLSGLFLYLIGMVRPLTTVIIKDQPPPRTAPVDTGVWFVAGITEKGPNFPFLIHSMAEYTTYFGARVSYGILYDCLDAFFREGGNKAYISRVLGPAPVVAFKNLLDVGAGVSLVVSAKNAGAWGNSLKVAVVAGSAGYPGTFQIQVSDANNVILEQSGDLVTQQDAITWSTGSLLVTITLGATALIPSLLALSALATGTDDRTNITDTQWQAALDNISADLGPGQISAPGQTTLTRQSMLSAHASARRRVALIDLPDSGSRATLVAAAIALRGLNARFAAAFAPWAVIPGVSPGTTRTIPYSAIEAGIMARNDVLNSANVPAAGDAGQAQYAVSLSQVAWSDIDRDLLNSAGVNVALIKYGAVRTYGYRTLVNAGTDWNWINLGGSRLVMQIAALANDIMETHLFDQIDGQGKLFGVINGELTALLNGFYADDSLYGATPQEAFNVDTGPSVNTPTTIANNEIHAICAIKPSPMGEYVELNLVKVLVSDKVS